jgi:peptide/nickel transport system permease protein
VGGYVARRLLNYVVLLFLAVSLTYFLAATQLHPRQLYELVNPPLDPVSIEQNLRSRNLSDQVPLLQRYWTWLQGVVLHWDWGEAPRGGDIGGEVSRRIWVSLRLITLGSLLGTVIGVLLGAWTATRQYKVSDRSATAASLFILSVPSFVIASALQVAATKFNGASGLRVFEFVGETGTHGTYPGAAFADRLQHLILPTIALTLINAAFFSRIQRNLMLDALGSDFVRTARAKGLRRSKAVMKHALRTALIPTGTYFAFSIATLFTGATFMEILFSFHGMGEYAVSTITQQDVHGTVAVVAFSGACVLVGAILSDVAVAILDPRVRLS